MSTAAAAPAPAKGAAGEGTPGEDDRFEMHEATVEWNDREKSLVEGTLTQLDWLKIISLEVEPFFPNAIYVRKEMCDVFVELAKKNRKTRQVLIGSPGVGKSTLLFLVALHRVLKEGTPTICVRKRRDPIEFVSVFFMRKTDDTHVQFFYDGQVDDGVTVRDAFGFVMSKCENVHTKPMVPIRNGSCLLHIDGLHEGNPDLGHPHHCLSTSGGFDAPQGESARGKCP